MNPLVSTQEVRERLTEYRGGIRNIIQLDTGRQRDASTPRNEVQGAAKELVEGERQLKEYQQREAYITRRAVEMAQEFLGNVTGDEGELERDNLVESLDAVGQEIYGHALTLATARAEDSDAVRMISPEHLRVLMDMHAKPIEDGLSAQLQEEKSRIDQLEMTLRDKDDIIDDLEAKARSDEDELERLQLHIKNIYPDIQASKQQAAAAELLLNVTRDANADALRTSKQRLEAAEDRIATLTDELQRVRQSSQEGLDEAKERVDKVRKKLQKSRKKCLRQTREANRAKIRIESLKRRSEKGDGSINGLKGRLKDAEEKLSLTEVNLDEARCKLQESREEARRQVEEADAAKSRIETLEREVSANQDSILGFQDTISSLKQEASAKEDSIADLQDTISRLEQEASAKEDSIADHQDNISSLKEEASAKDDSITDLQDTISSLKEEASAKDDSIADLQDTISRLDQEILDKSQDINVLRGQSGNLQRQLNTAKFKTRNLEQLVRDRDLSLLRILADLEYNQTNLERTTNELQESREEARRRVEEADAAKSRIETLERRVSTNQNSILNFQNTISKLQREASAKNNSILGFQNTISRLQREASAKNNSILGFQDTMSRLQHEASAKDDIISARENRIGELDAELALRERKLAVYERKLSTAHYLVAQSLSAHYKSTKPRPPAVQKEAWSTLADCFIGSRRVLLRRETNEEAASRFWTVAQPWPDVAGPPAAETESLDRVEVTGLISKLYGRLCSGDADTNLLETLSYRLVSLDIKGLLHRPFLALFYKALAQLAPTQDIETALFCFGLLQLALFIQSNWQVDIDVIRNLRSLLEETTCYQTLANLTSGRAEEASEICRQHGTVQKDIGFIYLQDYGILEVDFDELSLRPIHRTRLEILDDVTYVIRSPSGEQDILVDVTNEREMKWWFCMSSGT
ncbi:hypothetical protein K445DRAFT_163734 [Daldinia sp. EC12]|nr:hypothetical protein K445DRAFT_163734 [Daldinia sp. EC12]